MSVKSMSSKGPKSKNQSILLRSLRGSVFIVCGSLCVLQPLVSIADVEEKIDSDAETGVSVEALVAQLGHDSFALRVAAMDELWKRGKSSLPALSKALEGSDPEITSRARELSLYISSGVLPDSPDEVKQLVITYSRSPINERLTILRKLMALGQWKQVLHLARSEENPDDRLKMASLVQAAASKSARQAIVDGDFKMASEILELTGDDAQNMAMRAWFYVHQGQMNQQLPKAATMPGRKGVQWRMALHRANGDVKSAIKEAELAGFKELAAGMRVFTGDALPALELRDTGKQVSAILSMGNQIQRARLLGQTEKADAIARELARMDNNEDTAHQSAICLAANGYRKEAVSLITKHNVESAFDYFDNTESPQTCLELLGIPKTAKPPYTEWVKEFIEKTIDTNSEYSQLVMLAGFLDRHGQPEHAMAVMKPAMASLEEDGSDTWFDLLTEIREYDLGWMAIKFAEERGNEDFQMDLSVKKILGSSDSVNEVWNALKKRHPDNINEALREIALLAGIIADTHGETDKLHQELLNEIIGPNAKEGLAKAARSEALFNFAFKRNNVAEASRMVDILVVQNKRWERSKIFLDTALHRWEKIEPIYAQNAEKKPEDYHNLIKWCICLRHLNRDEEAAKVYDRALMLTMGNADALGKLAGELFESGFKEEATELWEHSALMSAAGAVEYDQAILRLAIYGEHLYNSKQWKKAAAIGEVYANIRMRGRSNGYLNLELRVRFYADFCHAMALLEGGKRELAIKKLDLCRQLIPGDGSLADHFFPILREANLGEHYELWFEDSYRQVNDACKIYPKSHNSQNTAAWLASRAVRRLDDAHRHAEAALKSRPLQGAYLDTMAEVWFARGNRGKAVEWSEKAVAASIGNAQGAPRTETQALTNFSQLSLQLHRFKKGELPK